MPIYQKLNPKTKAWVKFEKTSTGNKILDVKQKNPSIKFKGVKVKK